MNNVLRELIDEAVMSRSDANVDIYKKIVEDNRFGDIFRMVMFEKVMQSFACL